MSERPNLYAILGVSPDATQAEIGRAYRALLRRHHPDTRSVVESQSAVSDAALQHILAAYTVLRDPVRRAQYDRESSPPAPPAAPAPRRTPTQYDTSGRPPIVAGPVRWHRAH